MKNTLKQVTGNKRLIAVLAVAIILFAGVGSTMLSSTSYTTAYQGAKARFIGVKDLSTNNVYTNTLKHSSSTAWFDSQLNFDIDNAKGGKPNIAGEMTSVFIPKSSGSLPADWVPSSWWRDAMLWNNPTGTPYEWQIQNADGSTTMYRMEEWTTKWFMSLSAEWDLQGDEYYTALGVPPDGDWGTPEQRNQRYSNLQIWFEFDIQPSWYFEGGATPYFAVAKVELSQIKFEAKDLARQVTDTSQTVRVTPMSPGSILTLYNDAFGSSQATGKADFESFYYQGAKLNPQYFRDKVYGYITLNDFGTTEWWEPLVLKAKGDVVTFGFTVTQFVVGEWTVKDIQEIPDEYGRTAKEGESGFVGFTGFLEWLGTPAGQFWLFFILIIAAVVLVAVFAPHTFVLVYGLFKGLGSGGKRKR